MGDSSRNRGARRSTSNGGSAIFGLGLIGSLVYFWQQANGFWDHILGILKSLVWPAFLIYDAFRAVRG